MFVGEKLSGAGYKNALKLARCFVSFVVKNSRPFLAYNFSQEYGLDEILSKMLPNEHSRAKRGRQPSRICEPDNLLDSECDGRHFVLVHGYNVNSADARKWGDQMFKRLRLSGMKSMFTAVNWKGDESQFSLMFSDKQISPDYYINVKNAFHSAPMLVQACRDLPGEKVMLAHSLGNMLVSSAAKDHGLNYSKYYMLNAAVPMETYDNGSFSSVMCDEEWNKVPSNFWRPIGASFSRRMISVHRFRDAEDLPGSPMP